VPARFSLLQIGRVVFAPDEVFRAVAAEAPPATRVIVRFALWISLLPPLFAYVGTVKFGWRLGVQPVFIPEPVVLALCAAYFLALLLGLFSSAVIARWMAATYDASQSFGRCLALMSIVCAPLAVGSVIHLYYSDTGSPPKALEEALAKDRPGRIPLASLPDVAVRPRCPDCEGRLNIYNPPDNADLPKNDPHQLLEFTLGARIDLEPVKNPATDPPNGLDLKNVDFDVSYVNVAYGPAAMGPFGNDQVGYVGTPQTVDEFRGKPNRNGKYTNGLNQFLRLDRGVDGGGAREQ